MAAFEAKIREEALKDVSNSETDKIQTAIVKVTGEHDKLVTSLRQEHEATTARSSKATKLMVCMQNALVRILKEKLETREQELNL